ncbi:MAG: hypothetical protein LH473_03645 [Chitinophagales bacterium]|nr:hypothetical protein [Chitinophagales bacterium]
MKNLFIIFSITLTIISCKKEDGLPPVDNPQPYSNSYSGSYSGAFTETSSGVDSTGVVKFDTTYAYTVKVNDEGNFSISIHGATDVPQIPVDTASGYFIFEDYNRTIEGWFYDDSLHISSKALNGSPVPPLWFDIVQLEFKGKKIP